MKVLNLLLLVTIAVSLLACKEGGREALIGTWGVDDIDISGMVEGMTQEEKERFELAKPMMEQAMKSMEMVFNADGSLETRISYLGQQNSDTGKWSLSEDGKVLTTTMGGATEDIKLENLNNKTMVMVMESQGGSMKMNMYKK
jgi:hypothetical protein